MYKSNYNTILVILILFLCVSCFTEKDFKQEKIRSNKGLQLYMLQGWNTWSKTHLPTHVLMPEGLSVSLSFRKTFRNNYSEMISYDKTWDSITIPDEMIIPLAHNYNATFTHYKLIWEGLSADIQSTIDGEDLLILYSPDKLPENPHILILETGFLWGKPGVIEKKNNFVQAEVGTRAYSIGATANDMEIPLPLSSPYLSFESDKELGFFTGKSRNLEQIKKAIAKSEGKYKIENEKFGRLADVYNAMQNVLAWNLIYDAFNKRAITTVNHEWNEPWGGYVLLNGNPFFTGAMYAVNNNWHAYSNILALTNSVTPGGFIPSYTGALNNKSSFDRSQPPVGGLISMLIYKKFKQIWFLKESYENLLSWNRWWEKSRDNRGYLSWGSDPHIESPISNTKSAAILESGLENSPLFNDVVFNTQTHKLELASVDLMSLYIADCISLSEMAEILGKTTDKNELLKRAEKYTLKLKELWDENSGIYRDKDLLSNQFSTHLSPTNFYPLIAGIPTQEQASRMVNEYLLNPDIFFGEYMIPSVAKNNPAFKNDLNWQGGISPIMNFLVYLGLRNYDFPEARKLLADNSANILLKSWIREKRIYEFYNTSSGEGNDITNSGSFYTIGGLLALIPLMEEGYW